jgi:ribosomal-protein-alanine N-acetyltransferase
MFRTERLVLRPLESRDAESLHEAYTDTETLEWWHLPPSASLTESEARIEELRRSAATFAICLGDESAPAIGHAGWLTAPPGGRGAFGYLVRREHWGTGIAAEAAGAALRHGFDDLGVSSAELWVYDGNVRSARLAERLGCTLRGRFVAFNLARGRAFDTLVYGLVPPGAAQPPRVVASIPSFEVADVASTMEFWRDRLGFEVEFSVGDPPTMVSMVRGDWRPQHATVRFRAGDGPPTGVTLDVVAPDVDELDEELARRRAPIVEPITSQPWGLREVVVADPNGIRVRFYAPDLGASRTD